MKAETLLNTNNINKIKKLYSTVFR